MAIGICRFGEEAFRKESEKEKYSDFTAFLKGKVIAEYVATLQR